MSDSDILLLTSQMVNCRLNREGKYTKGIFSASLIWNTISDLDLSCVTPIGETISFRNKKSSCGGYLDIDMNVIKPYSSEPIENIIWTDVKPLSGEYKFNVEFYSNNKNGNNPVNYKLYIQYNNNQYNQVYNGTLTEKQYHTFSFKVSPAMKL